MDESHYQSLDEDKRRYSDEGQGEERKKRRRIPFILYISFKNQCPLFLLVRVVQVQLARRICTGKWLIISS